MKTCALICSRYKIALVRHLDIEFNCLNLALMLIRRTLWIIWVSQWVVANHQSTCDQAHFFCEGAFN